MELRRARVGATSPSHDQPIKQRLRHDVREFYFTYVQKLTEASLVEHSATTAKWQNYDKIR